MSLTISLHYKGNSSNTKIKMMTPAEIGRKLHSLVLKNSHDFSPHYNLFEKDFMDWYNKYDGLKTDIRVDLESAESNEMIKLSALLSDFTSVFPYHKDKFLYTFDPKAKGRKIIGPQKYLDNISKEIPNSQLFAGYASVSEEIIEDLFETLNPLIEAGKMLIRPEKIIFAAEIGQDYRASIHPADSNSHADEWRAINENQEQNSYPIFDNKSLIENHKQISEILVPYIQGIDLKEYSKILLDEEDLLSSFRVQMKSYMNMLKNENINSTEFKQDIIQPKLDSINRKFKHITNLHKLKVSGATLGTIGLFLVSLSQAGMIAALSQFITFGLGTVGFIKNETEYQDNLDKLKDAPEYLLWKLNKR